MVNSDKSNTYQEAFRDPERVRQLAACIRRELSAPITLMEVCGTHTMSVHRFGLRDLLPRDLKLLSGPGCPVCVTPNTYYEQVRLLAQNPDLALCSFGDLLRVPGRDGSLEDLRAGGADVRVVYSPAQALEFALADPMKKYVFLGIGFETTAPLTAAVIQSAQKGHCGNFFVLSGHKTMPPPMRALVESGEVAIDGFLCPGHVSVITGDAPYRFLAEEKGKPCLIAGFEPVDVLQGLLMLIRQRNEGRSEVEIQYTRAVRPDGNPNARELMQRIFCESDDDWRGLGRIPLSGLRIREEYTAYDAAQLVPPVEIPPEDLSGCICHKILRGIALPNECALFGEICVPNRPRGACMASQEGTCSIYYRYGR
ncbi:MAG TPA: hydrogenase formation protein HypD [bacterium]|nr:hydrogenase formation protein HypD [bacterium]